MAERRPARPAARVTLFGVGPVREALRAGTRKVHRIWLASGREGDPRIEALAELAHGAGVELVSATRDDLARRVPEGGHQGVLAEAEPLPVVELDAVLAERDGLPELVLALDGVQDPQNLGAILRTAECAGATAVVVPKDRAAPLSAAALKVAEGAGERVPVVAVVNLVRALEQLKERGFWVVGLEAGASAAWADVDLRVATVIVLGSEGQGIRRLVRETCDYLVSLPLRGHIESLNVAATAAAMLYEAVRQRRERESP